MDWRNQLLHLFSKITLRSSNTIACGIETMFLKSVSNARTNTHTHVYLSRALKEDRAPRGNVAELDYARKQDDIRG